VSKTTGNSNGTKVARARMSDRAAIRTAGLTYIRTSDLHLRRVRRGWGFRYLDAEGGMVRNPTLIHRLRALAVPPAYEYVRLAENARAHLQAIGRNAAGRLQYRYHPDWEKVREQRKAHRLANLVDSLSHIRRSVTRHLRGSEPTREFALAAVVALVSETALRPGREIYARQHGSRGAATLLKSNVTTQGPAVTLKFRAKRGQPIKLTFRSARVAKAIRVLATLPGRRLFQYLDGSGQIRNARRRQVNEFLCACAATTISLKDFRTLIASTSVLDRLARAEPACSAAARQRQVMAAVKETAENLANTPAVCRRSYVHDAIVTAFENGELQRLSDKMRAYRWRDASGCWHASSPQRVVNTWVVDEAPWSHLGHEPCSTQTRVGLDA
jgi:DNA topoisomerase-1